MRVTSVEVPITRPVTCLSFVVITVRRSALFALAGLVVAPLANAPVASADCVNAGNATVCAQGTVSGGGGGIGPR